MCSLFRKLVCHEPVILKSKFVFLKLSFAPGSPRIPVVGAPDDPTHPPPPGSTPISVLKWISGHSRERCWPLFRAAKRLSRCRNAIAKNYLIEESKRAIDLPSCRQSRRLAWPRTNDQRPKTNGRLWPTTKNAVPGKLFFQHPCVSSGARQRPSCTSEAAWYNNGRQAFHPPTIQPAPEGIRSLYFRPRTLD